MIDLIVEDIIDYITRDVMPEHWNLSHLVNGFKRYIRNEYDKEEIPKYIEFIKQLKEIRRIYQKGKPFVKNQTKKQKKGINFRFLYFIKSDIKKGEIDKATKYAKEHLEGVKRNQSQRTYYYHKKKIRKLGIEI